MLPVTGLIDGQFVPDIAKILQILTGGEPGCQEGDDEDCGKNQQKIGGFYHYRVGLDKGSSFHRNKAVFFLQGAEGTTCD